MKTLLLVYSDILKSVKTTSQQDSFVSQIDKLLTSLYQTEHKAFEKALASTDIEVEKIIKETFLKKNSRNFDKEMVHDFLTQLQEKAQNLKIITLSVAFSPTEHAIDTIFDWVTKNIGDGIVLDIQKDKSILGGAAVSFEGKYMDLTLKKTLDEVFASKRKEIESLQGLSL